MSGAGRRYAIITEGYLADRHAKTAHGVMQYGRDDVVAIIDSSYAGKDALDVVPHLGRPAPIVASMAQALTYRPTSLLLGVATAGGIIPPAFREHVLVAIDDRQVMDAPALKLSPRRRERVPDLQRLDDLGHDVLHRRDRHRSTIARREATAEARAARPITRGIPGGSRG